MPLLFNEKPLDDATIMNGIMEILPKGKDKTVVFSLINAPIMVRFTERGIQTMSRGGTKPMSTSQLATINGIQGILTYYTSKTLIQVKGGGQEWNYEPKYVYFRDHEMLFNGDTRKDLLFLMKSAKHNEKNAEAHGVSPLYRMMDTGAAAKKRVDGVASKLKAYDAVREAEKKNKSKIKALYESIGGRNFNELKATGDWDTILEPIYALCESNPKRIIELLESAALDTGAKVTQALESGILKQDSQGFYWGKGGKKIWNLPQGKGDEAHELFVDFLRNQDKSGVLAQMTKEIEVADIKELVS